jgi:hypothetical protein
VADRTDLPVSALPDYEQTRVHKGIDVESRTAATSLVEQLRRDACPTPAPSVTPTATASPTAASTPAASPTPAPPPPYCHG